MNFTGFAAPARYASLPALLEWLNGQTQAAGLDIQHSLRLQLVVEELFANAVEHGWRGESERPVRLALAVAPNALVLRYSDSAPAFDLTAPTAPRSPDRPGGYGLDLVRSLPSRIRYRRAGGRNVVEMEFDLEPVAAG